MTNLKESIETDGDFALFQHTIDALKEKHPDWWARYNGVDKIVAMGAKVDQKRIDWSKYPNFSEDEFRCKCGCGACKIEEEVVAFCQALRDHMGKPVRILSGYRCRKHNDSIPGAAKDSEHVNPGSAADILCANSRDRFVMKKFAYAYGVRRIGTYKHQGFLHFGFSKRHAQDVEW